MLHERLTKSVVERTEAGPKDVIVWNRNVKGFDLKVKAKRQKSLFRVLQNSIWSAAQIVNRCPWQSHS